MPGFGFDSLRRSPGSNFLSSRLSLLSAENTVTGHRTGLRLVFRREPSQRGHCLLLPPLHPWSVLVWRLTLLLCWTDTISQPPLVLRLLNEPLSPPSEKGLPCSATSQGNQGQAYRESREDPSLSPSTHHAPKAVGREGRRLSEQRKEGRQLKFRVVIKSPWRTELTIFH